MQNGDLARSTAAFAPDAAAGGHARAPRQAEPARIQTMIAVRRRWNPARSCATSVRPASDVRAEKIARCSYTARPIRPTPRRCCRSRRSMMDLIASTGFATSIWSIDQRLWPLDRRAEISQPRQRTSRSSRPRSPRMISVPPVDQSAKRRSPRSSAGLVVAAPRSAGFYTSGTNSTWSAGSASTRRRMDLATACSALRAADALPTRCVIGCVSQGSPMRAG